MNITKYEKVMTRHRKKCPHVVISMHHVIGFKQSCGIKNVTLKTTKNFVGVAVYWEE